MSLVKRIAELALAVATLVWVGAGSAQAYSEEYTGWHNGSKMSVSIDEDTVVIRYVRPKGSLRKHGVRNGTVLFDGHINGNRRIEGDAKVFRKGCSPASYFVSGRFKQGRRSFTLRGDAPRRASGGCSIVGYTSSGSNARLGFNNLVSEGNNDTSGHDQDEEEESDGGVATPGSGGGNVCGWYAIYSCGKSYSSAQNAKDSAGYGKIVNTNTVPNFRNGYYCLVNGPTNKGQARQWKNNASSQFGSAYIKKGC